MKLWTLNNTDEHSRYWWYLLTDDNDKTLAELFVGDGRDYWVRSGYRMGKKTWPERLIATMDDFDINELDIRNY